ncbi:MAG: Crp/Fnr family transcriptional regulator [Bacteroidota bacterium]
MSNVDWQEVEDCLTKKRYKKGEILLHEGRICKKLYFLESGALRFFITKDGDEISKFFTLPLYCFTSQRSFNNEIPAQESIAALEDSIVWEMSRKDAYELYRLDSWSSFVRKLTQEVQFFTEQILEEIQNYTAEERYCKMIDQGDLLLQKVPLKHLATYLGIAPQSLSRIRKKYMDRQRT